MSDFLRGEDDEVASFFAFQDVITAVLGILILIALQLSFSINVESAESGNEISDSGADRISEEEFKEAQTQAEKLTETLESTRRQVNEQSARKRELLEAQLSETEVSASKEILETEIIQLESDLEKVSLALVNHESSLKESAEELGLTKSLKTVQSLSLENQEMQNTLTTSTQRLSRLEQELSEANEKFISEEKKNSFWLIPQRDENTKRPLLVTIDKRHMQFEEFNKPESLRVLSTSSLSDSLKAGIARYDPKKFRIIFLFKPSGSHTFEKITDLAKRLGYDIGYDPIRESQTVIFSVP